MLNQELFFNGVKKLQRSFEFVECKDYYFDVFDLFYLIMNYI